MNKLELHTPFTYNIVFDKYNTEKLNISLQNTNIFFSYRENNFKFVFYF